MSAIFITSGVLILISLIATICSVIAAKISGVLIEKVRFGSGPLIYRFNAGQTEYEIHLIPIVTSFQCAGEGFETDETIPNEVKLRHKPWYVRVFVTFWISLFPLLFGTIVLGWDSIPIILSAIPEFFAGVFSPTVHAQQALLHYVALFNDKGWLLASAEAAIRVTALSLIPFIPLCGIGQLLKVAI
ncbi:MAG: hypothetical protein ACJA16_001165 [Akkermansiaceae bacterium]|jgi:hypothetical protein